MNKTNDQEADHCTCNGCSDQFPSEQEEVKCYGCGNNHWIQLGNPRWVLCKDCKRSK